MRHSIRLAPLLLVAAAIAAGCGSDDSDPTTTAGSGPDTTIAEPSGSEVPGPPAGVRAEVCRDDGDETRLLRVTGVGCGTGQMISSAWDLDASCRPAAGESRSACSVGEYRCLAAVVGRGIAVSCARPGRSISFIVRR